MAKIVDGTKNEENQSGDGHIGAFVVFGLLVTLILVISAVVIDNIDREVTLTKQLFTAVLSCDEELFFKYASKRKLDEDVLLAQKLFAKQCNGKEPFSGFSIVMGGGVVGARGREPGNPMLDSGPEGMCLANPKTPQSCKRPME